MSDKTIVLQLGGQERTLQFGKNSFLKHLSKVAPDFDFLSGEYFTDPGKAYYCTLYFIWAGLLCGNYKDLTLEEVETWVDELDSDFMDDILYTGLSAVSHKSVEELRKIVAEATKKLTARAEANGVQKVNI